MSLFPFQRSNTPNPPPPAPGWFLSRSSKMAALTAALQKASLGKNDLDLELEELEAAAQMVVEDEEEEGGGESRGSSSSSSSDESEASEAKGEASDEEEGGGGGATCKDNPRSPGPPLPQEPSNTLASPSAPRGCTQLIQELEERVAEELKICQDRGDAAEGGSSPAERAAGTDPGHRAGTLPEPGGNPLLLLATQEDN